MIQVYRNWRG